MIRTPLRRTLTVIGIGAVLALGACGADSDDDGAATAGDAPTGATDQPAAATGVVIEGFKFSPTPLVVKAGTTITVVNKDTADHTLTAVDGSFDTGTLKKGATGTITAGEPGEIAYRCTIHDYMKGVIRIEA